jgi:hypothetical protein
VLLDEQGEPVLLVWPEDRARWDDEESAVEFIGDSGEPILLRDGDMVSLGGGGSSNVEDGRNADDFLESVGWVSQPSRNCVMDVRWFVGDLVAENGT